MNEIEWAILKLKRIKEVVECGMKYLLSPQEVLRVIHEQGDSFYDDITTLLRAELSRQENAPLTWNERINQMTVEEKAWELVDGELSRAIERAIDFSYDNSDGTEYDQELIQKAFLAGFLASPYTEGETK